jgi:hypothetical protein
VNLARVSVVRLQLSNRELRTIEESYLLACVLASLVLKARPPKSPKGRNHILRLALKILSVK